MSFATGWTREYVLDNLTLAHLLRYYEYAEEYMADYAQMIALEIGYALGYLKRKQTPELSGVDDYQHNFDGGVSALLMKNIRG